MPADPVTEFERYREEILAAEALGLAAFWRSNTSELAEAKRLLGLPPAAQVVAFVNLGRPDPAGTLPTKARRTHAELTDWLGWEDEPAG